MAKIYIIIILYGEKPPRRCFHTTDYIIPLCPRIFNTELEFLRRRHNNSEYKRENYKLPRSRGGTEQVMEDKIKRRVELNVAGITMSLVTDESDEFVATIARHMDESMTQLLHDIKRSQLDAAMLCAIDFCADKLTAEKRVRNLEAQVSLYDVNTRRLKEEIARLRARLGELEGDTSIKSEPSAAPAERPLDAQMTIEESSPELRAESDEESRDSKLRLIEALLRREGDK